VPKIIGLVGRARCGKSTFAGMLAGELVMHSNDVTIRGFADNLRDMCNNFFGHDFYDDRVKTMEIFPGITGGMLLQKVGTDWFRSVDTDFWVKRMEKYLTDFDDYLIIPDVRFENEAKWVKDNDGYLVRLHRRVDVPGRDPNHPSETAQESIQVDGHVFNQDISLDDLSICARSYAARLMEEYDNAA